jgi:hypothetical protein
VFQIAEDHLGIPQVIDPRDMVNPDPNLRPDEQCIMTYLSEFPRAFLNLLEAQRAAGVGVLPGGAGTGATIDRKSLAMARKSMVGRQSVIGTRVTGEGGEVGIQFGEIGYMSGAPVGKPQFSVAEIFNPSVSQAQLFSVPQAGGLAELDPAGLPSSWELQKAMTDAELQRLMEEKLRLEEELRALRSVSSLLLLCSSSLFLLLPLSLLLPFAHLRSSTEIDWHDNHRSHRSTRVDGLGSSRQERSLRYSHSREAKGEDKKDQEHCQSQMGCWFQVVSTFFLLPSSFFLPPPPFFQLHMSSVSFLPFLPFASLRSPQNSLLPSILPSLFSFFFQLRFGTRRIASGGVVRLGSIPS